MEALIKTPVLKERVFNLAARINYLSQIISVVTRDLVCGTIK